MKVLGVILSTFLRAFGALWALTEPVTYFGGEKFAAAVRPYWWLFLLVAVIACVIQLRPRKRFTFKLAGKDISIELIQGDLFKQKGPIVIGSNTDFITSPETIALNSVQGIFTERFVESPDAARNQIIGQIGEGPHEFGTTASVKARGRTGYFVALAEINSNGVAKSNIENVRVALAGLWDYLSNHGEKSMVNIPVVGTGYSRVSNPRQEVVQEIVRSFIASTAQHTFCDGLRIVVHPSDVRDHHIDMVELAEFIEYSCKYSLVKPLPAVAAAGTAED